MAADREQAEIHFSDHDLQIPGALLRGRGRDRPFLCGDQGPVRWQSPHPGEDGPGH